MADDPVSVLPGTRSSRGIFSSVRTVAASLALPLTLLGALLYLAGFWSPWLSGYTALTSGYISGAPVSSQVSGSAVTFTSLLSLVHYHAAGSHLTFGWYGWLDVLAMAWDLLPLCGIVVSLALWQRRRASRVLLGVSIAWLLFATVLAVIGTYGAFADFAGERCVGDCATVGIVEHLWITWGLWLTLGALLLAWVALGLHLWNPATDRGIGEGAEDSTSARAVSRSARVGASLFTLGAVIWALGLLLVPWVTAGCSGIPLSVTHFVRGSCSGLDGYDVLSAGMVNGSTGALGAAVWDMGLDPYRVIVLLLFAGVVLAALLWRPGRLGRARRVRAMLPVAATAWVLLAVAEFVVGWEGTTYRLGHRGAVVFGGPPQVVGPGLWLCAVGILCTVAGAGAGWLHVRQRCGDA